MKTTAPRATSRRIDSPLARQTRDREKISPRAGFVNHSEAYKEAKLSYLGNLLVEDRNGLIVNSEVFEANGTAERDAALVMLEKIPGGPSR